MVNQISRYSGSIIRVKKAIDELIESVDETMAKVKSITNEQEFEDLEDPVYELCTELESKLTSLNRYWANWCSQIEELGTKNKKAEEQKQSQFENDNKFDYYEYKDSIEKTVFKLRGGLSDKVRKFSNAKERVKNQSSSPSIPSAPVSIVEGKPFPGLLPGFTAPKSVQLPPLKLPEFNGTTWQFQEFWEQFKIMIHDNPCLDDTQRHTYLRSCVSGEAETALKQIPMTGKYYSDAVDLLKESFDQPLTTKVVLAKKLKTLSCDTSSSQSQLNMTREAKALIRQVKSVCPTETFDLFQMDLIQKYGPSVRTFICEKLMDEDGDGKKISIDDLLKTIEKHLVHKITIDATVSQYDSPYSISRKVQNTNYSSGPPVSPQATRSVDKCVYCSKHINSADCRTYPLKFDRCKILKETQRCYQCTQKGHLSCSATCSKCGGDHHVSVCVKEYETSQATGGNAQPLGPAKSKDNRKPNHQQATVAQSGTAGINTVMCDDPSSHLAKPKMLTGVVVAKNPVTEVTTDADFFMDSGATCSFITPDLAKKLDLFPIRTANLKIKLAGGNSIPKKSYDVTELILCKGEYKTKINPVIFDRNSLVSIKTDKSNTSIPECDLKYISEHSDHIALSDIPDRSHPVNPQILINISDMMRMLTDGGTIRQLPSGMMMIPTYLGNVIGGDAHSPRGPTNHDKRPSELPLSVTDNVSTNIPGRSPEPIIHTSMRHGTITEQRGDDLFVGFIHPTDDSESDTDFTPKKGKRIPMRRVVSMFSNKAGDSDILFFAPPPERLSKKKKRNRQKKPEHTNQAFVGSIMSEIVRERPRYEPISYFHWCCENFESGKTWRDWYKSIPTVATLKERQRLSAETIQSDYRNDYPPDRKAEKPIILSEFSESRTTTSHGLNDMVHRHADPSPLPDSERNATAPQSN